MSSKITLKNGPGIPKKAGSTILAPGEPGWSTDLEKLYVGTADPQVPAMVGKPETYVNVKDHGAKGDGVTDDTASIKAAQTESMSRNIPVFFPAGTYVAKSIGNFDTVTRIHWFGESRENTKITDNGDASAAGDLYVLINGSITLSDLTLDRKALTVSTGDTDTFLKRCHLTEGSVVDGESIVQINCTGAMAGVSSKANTTFIGCSFTKNIYVHGFSTFVGCVFTDIILGVPKTATGRFIGCKFVVTKPTLDRIIDYTGGRLCVRDSSFKVTSATVLADFAIVRMDDNIGRETGSVPYGLDIDATADVSATGTWHYVWKKEAAGINTTILPIGITIRSHLPRAKTTLNNNPATPTYEHHTDGIWWNGTKITP